MSVTINAYHTADVPGPGAKLAQVSDTDVYIWPEGIGNGPMIAMSKQDWRRISREVMLAWMRAEGIAP